MSCDQAGIRQRASLLAAVDSPNGTSSGCSRADTPRAGKRKAIAPVLTRCHSWPEDLRQIVWEHRSRLSGTVRDLVLSSDFEESLRGLEAALWASGIRPGPSSSQYADFSDAFLGRRSGCHPATNSAEALAAECATSQPGRAGPSPETLRQHFLHSLARGGRRFGSINTRNSSLLSCF